MKGHWQRALTIAKDMLGGEEGQEQSPPLTASALPLPEILEAAVRVSPCDHDDDDYVAVTL